MSTSTIGVIVSILWLVFLQITVTPALESGDEDVKIEDRDLSDTDIAFDLPDLTALVETTTGSYQVEAFKSVNNDKMLRDSASYKASQLSWVSVGKPTFVKTPSPKNPKVVELFHSSNFGFTTYIQMLTPSQRSILSSAANTKHRVVVTEKQIVNLILSKFECLLTMFDETGNKYLLTGNVFEFREFPLRMDFLAKPASIERKRFESLFKDESDLRFVCTMASQGKLSKTNTLVITAQQQQLIGIEEKLFGSATTGESKNDSYVTRDQMIELSSEMYTTLNIVEDYQMSEGQFSDAFVEGMINQIATEQFKQVPIDTVLASLSKYGFDFDEDLNSDVIKRDMGSIMTVKKENGKSRIILDETSYANIQSSNSRSFGFEAKTMDVGSSVNWARNNAKTHTNETRSLNDQLRELNTVSQKNVQWDIVGSRVVPKSLNVARMARTKLGKTLSFTRVRIQTFAAPFDRRFAINPNRAAASAEYLETLTSRISTLENTTLPTLTSRISTLENTHRSDINSIRTTDNSITANIKHMTSSIQKLSTTISQLNQKQANSEARTSSQINSLSKTSTSLDSRLSTLDKQAIRRCRLCFKETQASWGQCNGARDTCTGWNSGWTDHFHDDTDARIGGCTYRWSIECVIA